MTINTEENIFDVMWTKNLDQFKFLPYNRPVDESRVDKIARVIKKDGFLVPILANQSYYIIDGQHRLAAAKKLNIKVSYLLYKIDDDKVPIIVSQLNSTATKWKIEDYFNMWLCRESSEYVNLSKLFRSFDINFQIGWRITFLTCGANAGGGLLGALKDGSLTMSDNQTKRISERLKNYNELLFLEKRFIEFPESFHSALSSVVTNKYYIHSIMLESLKQDSGRLLRARSKTDYLIELQYVYNKVATKKQQIKFTK